MKIQESFLSSFPFFHLLLHSLSNKQIIKGNPPSNHGNTAKSDYGPKLSNKTRQEFLPKYYADKLALNLEGHNCKFICLVVELLQDLFVFISYMKNLRYHFPTCYAYSVKEPIGELNLKRALDEDSGVFSFFFSLLSSSSPLGQTAVSGNSTLHQ